MNKTIASERIGGFKTGIRGALSAVIVPCHSDWVVLTPLGRTIMHSDCGFISFIFDIIPYP